MTRRILGPLILGVVGTAILLALGVWQLQRLDWKQALLARIESGIAADPVPLPAAVDPSQKYLPVTVSGTTTGDELFVISGMKGQGGGYQVIAAFETADGRRIMVDRGFLHQDDRAAVRPPVPLAVTGNLHWPDEAGSATPPPNLAENRWFARDVPAMADALDAQPVLVVAAAVDGAAQGITPIPVAVQGIPNNHLAYAVQWFLLAAVWAGMTAWLVWRISQRRY